MRTPDIIVLSYVAYLAALALVRPLPRHVRLQVLAGCAGLAAVTVTLALAPPWPRMWLVRDIVLLPSILVCYRLSGKLSVAPQPAFEASFAAFDARVQRLLQMPGSVARAPRAVVELLEAAYLACYVGPLAGYLALVAAGHGRHTDWYWSVVLLSVFVCYACVPWIRTRAPWALEPAGPMDRREVVLRRLNRFVLRHGSIQVNMFPSAHTASVLGAGLALAPVLPVASVLLMLLAASIAAATVAGRYHYAGDAVAAVVSTLAVWAGALLSVGVTS